jgi:CHAT domain-containing protein
VDLASVYAATHETETLECYVRALPIAERMGDEEGRAAIFMGMGLAHDWLGELQRALDDFDHSITLSRQRGDRRGLAVGLTNLSMSYNRIGEHQRALDVLDESLRLRREIGDRRGEAYTLTSLGRTYDLMGKKDEALAFYNKALRLRRAVGDRRGEAYTLGLLGMACSALGENEAALQYLESSLELRRSLGGVADVGGLLRNVGVVRAALGEKQRALDTLAVALASNHAMADPLQEAQTLYETARVEAGLGNLPEARERLENALTLVESIRARLASSAQRAAFLATTVDTFGLALDVWMSSYAQSHDPAFAVEALALAERARARSMLELLVESHVDIREGVAPGLLERETASKRRLAAAVEKRMRLLSASHTQEQADAGDREIGGLESELEKIESEVRADSPRYAALTQPRPATAADIQRSLDPETLLLEFGLGKERVFLWAITPASIESHEIGDRSEIELAAHQYFDLLTERTRRRRPERGKSASANAEYAKAASELSRRLLSPVRDRLSGKRLLIVADGALQYVPFGALPDPAGVGDLAVLLVAHHEIVSLPSASILGAMRRDLAGRPPAPKTLAVLADPVFERDDERVSRATAGRGATQTSRRPEGTVNRAAYRSAPEVGLTRGETARIPRLLYSRREADSILSLVPKAARLRAVDFEASRERAMSAELGHYRFVHFATHGFLNGARPELSGIVFSLVDPRGREVPGYLSTADAFNMTLPVDLVVLSGCQTALGRDVRGEGLVGLVRGLMYAGARAVVASLWKVDDAATAEFMRRFYSAMLRDGLAPASALRRTQVEMSRSSLWSDPVYWAAFVLQGDCQSGPAAP